MGEHDFLGTRASYAKNEYNPFYHKLGAEYFCIRLLFRKMQYFSKKTAKTPYLGALDHFAFFSALKIHCSAECKALLDRLGGYTVVKRGVIGMKGKGEVLTYWLIGEDNNYRAKRSEERTKRREQTSRKDVSKRSRSFKMENNVQPTPTAAMAPRSSLKNKNSLACPRNVVARCVSLESPKKLRFANGSILDCNPYHKCSHDPLVDVIFSEMSGKRRPSKVLEQGDEYADQQISVSCPCIENIALTCETKPKKPAKRSFEETEYDNACCNSEPLLLTSSIPCISVSSEKDISTKQIADINTPLLQNYCTSAI